MKPLTLQALHKELNTTKTVPSHVTSTRGLDKRLFQNNFPFIHHLPPPSRHRHQLSLPLAPILVIFLINYYHRSIPIKIYLTEFTTSRRTTIIHHTIKHNNIINQQTIQKYLSVFLPRPLHQLPPFYLL